MKKISLFLSALLFTLSVGAQQSSYTLKMQMRMEGLPPEQAAYGEQDFTYWVKDSKSKTEMSGLMGTVLTFSDGKTITSLTDFFGNKMGYTATQEEMAKLDKKEKEEAPPKIEYTSEKKNILSYECTKAIVTSTDKEGKPQVLTVWVTDKLASLPSDARKGRRSGFNLGDLKGLPLAIETSFNGNGTAITLKITATEVSTTAIDDNIFVPSTEGFKMMSYTDFQASMKGMGGR